MDGACREQIVAAGSQKVHLHAVKPEKAVLYFEWRVTGLGGHVNKTGDNMGGIDSKGERSRARIHAPRIANVILTLLALVLIMAASYACGKRGYESAGSITLQPGMDMKSASSDDYASGEAAPPSNTGGQSYLPSSDRNASVPAGEARKYEKQLLSLYADPGWEGPSASSLFTQTAFAQETNAGVKPMIIYNGSLAIKVAKLKDASDTVIKMLPKYDGYISNMSEDTRGTMQLVTITARVGAGKVMDFIADVKKVGEVLSSNLTGDEVTEEFVDQQSQLSALRISEARLKEMLSKSGKLSDLLEIERELSNKQAQINQVMGRMRYLTDRSTRATVEITLQTEAPPPPSTIQFAWGFGEVFQQAWVNLKYTVRSFIAGVITFAVSALFWLPALVVIVLVLIGIWRWLRRKGIIVWADEKKE